MKTNDIEKAYFDSLILYMQDTKESEWATDVCLSEDGKQKCVINHIIESDIGIGMEQFKVMTDICTRYLYDVNDGHNPDYQQKTRNNAVLLCLETYLRTSKEPQKEHIHTLLRRWRNRKKH